MHVCHDPEWLASQSYTVNFVPLNSTENTDFWKTVPMYFYVYLVMDLLSRGRYPEPLGTGKARKQIIAAHTEGGSDGDFPGASECCVPTRVTLYGYTGSWGKLGEGRAAGSAESSYSAGLRAENAALRPGRQCSHFLCHLLWSTDCYLSDLALPGQDCSQRRTVACPSLAVVFASHFIFKPFQGRCCYMLFQP